MRLNKAVFVHALRGQWAAQMRVVLAGLLTLMLYGLVSSGMSINGQALLGTTLLVKGGNSLLLAIVWVLGLGLIRGDVQSGSIQLALLRPLTRASYVLSKWAALLAVGLAVLLLAHASFLAKHGLAGSDPLDLALLLGAQAVQVAAVAALLALFSCVPIAFGELGLLALGLVLMAGLKLANLHYEWGLVDQALALAWRVLLPGVSLDNGSGDLLAGMAFNAVEAVAALGGAIAILQRREFTYAD